MDFCYFLGVQRRFEQKPSIHPLIFYYSFSCTLLVSCLCHFLFYFDSLVLPSFCSCPCFPAFSVPVFFFFYLCLIVSPSPDLLILLTCVPSPCLPFSHLCLSPVFDLFAFEPWGHFPLGLKQTAFFFCNLGFVSTRASPQRPICLRCMFFGL